MSDISTEGSGGYQGADYPARIAAELTGEPPPRYNADGFTADGFNRSGYDAEGYSRRGFNRRGYDRNGFNQLGYNADGFDRTGFDGTGYNAAGFNRYGYNANGFDEDGYGRSGFNAAGLNRAGFNRRGFDRDGFNANGFDRYGYGRDGFDRNSYDRTGYNADGLDRYGCDRTGYNADGFDRYGYNANGYNADGRNRFGCDRTGYTAAGYDRFGFNRDGYNAAGYDRNGYNADGFDAYGFNRDGYNAVGFDPYGCDRSGYTPDGFDRYGYDRNGYNASGYNASGYNAAGYNAAGYNRDGFNRYGEHVNDSRSCCRSPQRNFTIRNDGQPPLANDTRATIALPEGQISAEGINEIRKLLCAEGNITGNYQFNELSYTLESLDSQWQTRTGNYVKRLSALAYKRHQMLKLSPAILSQVGNIARDHSKPVNFHIEVTRNLNLPSDKFYNAGSCWWGSGSYGDSRCAFKTGGGFGLRTFDPDNQIRGRAWVLPLRQGNEQQLTTTFDTMTPDAFVVFNGYGDLQGFTGARLISHLAGWTYKQVTFSNNAMYINGGTGYLIAAVDVTTRTEELQLHLTRHSDLYETEMERNAHVA